MLDWISSNPWLSAWLAWPLALVLVAFSWSVATALSSVISSILNWVYLMGCLLVTIFRGYPPAAKRDDEGNDDSGGSGDKESKPLAS